MLTIAQELAKREDALKAAKNWYAITQLLCAGEEPARLRVEFAQKSVDRLRLAAVVTGAASC